MELINVLRVLRRWWWLILLLPVVTTAALWFGLRSAPPVYEASVKLQLTTPQREDVAAYEEYRYGNLRDEITVARNNFTQVVQGSEVRNRTISQLGLKGVDREYLVEVVPVRDADFLYITVKGRSPGLVAEIANTHANAAIAYYGDLRAKPTYAERDLFAEKLRIAEESFRTAEDRFAQFQAESNIVSLEEQLSTYQRLLEQLQLERDRLLLEDTSRAVDPISEVDRLISAHEHELDRLAALAPAYNVLQEDVQLARENYRRIWPQETGASGNEEEQPAVEPGLALEELRTAEDAFASFKAQQGIVSLETEMDTHQTLLTQLKLERDRLLLAESSRDAEAVSQVDQLIAQRRLEMDRLSALAPTHDLLAADLAQAHEQYAYILNKYTEAELKAAAVKAANFIQIVESAQSPVESTSKTGMLLVLAFAGSLGLGTLLAFLFEYIASAVSDRIPLDESDGQRALGLPILGMVPRMDGGRCAPGTLEAETVRQLRTRLLQSSPGGRSQTLLVTSPQPKDGKTVVAANLGIAMATGTMRVLLVDADLRCPALHELFDQPNLDGLANWLEADENSLERLLPQLLRDTPIPGLSLITAGRPPQDPSLLLASRNMALVLEILSERFDSVVVDGPPVVSAPDAVVLARLVQATLLVLSPDRTSRRIAVQAIDSLTSWNDIQIIGTALNRTSPHPYAYRSYGRQTRPSQKVGRVASVSHLMGRREDAGLISTRQVAAQLGVRDKAVKRWCREGRLPAVKSRLRWWVKQDELDAMTPAQLLDLARLESPTGEALDERPAHESLQQTASTLSAGSPNPRPLASAGKEPKDAEGERVSVSALASASSGKGPGSVVHAAADRA